MNPDELDDQIEFTVIGTPAPQGSKRHVGRGILIESSKKVKPWREAVKHAAYEARAGRAPFDGPLHVGVDFYLTRPRSHYRTGKNAALLRASAPPYPATKPDLDKLLRSTLDALGEAGIYTDDARVVSVTMNKHYADPTIGLDVPGARIVILDADTHPTPPAETA